MQMRAIRRCAIRLDQKQERQLPVSRRCVRNVSPLLQRRLPHCHTKQRFSVLSIYYISLFFSFFLRKRKGLCVLCGSVAITYEETLPHCLPHKFSVSPIPQNSA